MLSNSKIIVAASSVFLLLLIAASILSIYRGGALFIPGIAPAVFKAGDKIQLNVNKITSIKAAVPYRYHDLPVCIPEVVTPEYESLGTLLGGNRLENSVYNLIFLEEVQCKATCPAIKMTPKQKEFMISAVKLDYQAEWQVDSLPSATKGVSSKTSEELFTIGFPIGNYVDENSPIVFNNHVDLKIHYSKYKNPSTGVVSEDQFNIVLFEVVAKSFEYTDDASAVKNCQSSKKVFTVNKDDKEQSIAYTYSVNWVQSKVEWKNRWQSYRAIQGSGQIHWFSIINSVLIIFVLSSLVAIILAKTLRKDFISIEEEEGEKLEDETGWKLLHADVFRAPNCPGFLSVLVGSGIQVLLMCVITLIFSVFGLLSPANQGSLLTAAVVLYVWMGIAAGYCSSRIYNTFQGENNLRNTILTAVSFPGTIFLIVLILDIPLVVKNSSGAFPFTTLLAVFTLWVFVSIPLSYIGSKYASTVGAYQLPGTVTLIPRPIQVQKWYLNKFLTVMVGGLLPFGAVFIELFFIFSSIWLNRVYFLFGFLFLVFLIMFITCAEISIVMCYFQLGGQDWEWWWRAFLTSGSSAFYVFLYSIYYFVEKLEVRGFVPSLLYFGYTSILCLGFFVITGTIGFYATFYFMKKIYSAIHQD